MECLNTVQISGCSIGSSHPCYVIAEVGINHNGSLPLAIETIDAAHEAGADAVKLQVFEADTFIHPKASNFEFVKSAELTYDEFETIFEHAKMNNITVFATPESLEDISFLKKMSPPAMKIASMDLNYRQFIQTAARLGVPVILSTGMGYQKEVENAVNWIRSAGNPEIILLHCVSCYPVAPEDVNLCAIKGLQSMFNVPVGYSDHSEGIHIPFAAVVSGASVIEKHFTLNKSLPGPDHKGSADPQDLSRLISEIRAYELAAGIETKKPSPCEEKARLNKRRSIYAARSIEKGDVLQMSDVLLLTPSYPESQIEQLELFLGNTVNKKVHSGDLISAKLFESK